MQLEKMCKKFEEPAPIPRMPRTYQEGILCHFLPITGGKPPAEMRTFLTFLARPRHETEVVGSAKTPTLQYPIEGA